MQQCTTCGERLERDDGDKASLFSATSSSSSSSASAADERTIEREVCWKLDKRGDAGETALHLCLLFSIKERKFADIANALLDCFPKLSVDYYENDEYYGTHRPIYCVISGRR